MEYLGLASDFFFPRDIQQLVNQPVVLEDFHSWKLAHNGQFTVKSAYLLDFEEKTKRSQPEAFNQPSVNILKEKVWKVLSAPKIRVFLRKALNRALPVGELIEARGTKVDSRCQVCGGPNESINHLLFECPLARHIWVLTGIPNLQNGFHPSSVYVNFNYLLSLEKRCEVVPHSYRVGLGSCGFYGSLETSSCSKALLQSRRTC